MRHITIGILAHVDAGKTTLSECMLYLSGQIRKLGRVDHKDAFLDTYELERERGITIFSKQAELKMGNLGITLLDTPGHVDFSAEMERTLQVLDYAILVINGADGVQGHTRTCAPRPANYGPISGLPVCPPSYSSIRWIRWEQIRQRYWQICRTDWMKDALIFRKCRKKHMTALPCVMRKRWKSIWNRRKWKKIRSRR